MGTRLNVVALEGLGLVMEMEVLRRSLVGQGRLRFLVGLGLRFLVDLLLCSLVEVDRGSLGDQENRISMGIIMNTSLNIESTALNVESSTSKNAGNTGINTHKEVGKV